MRRLRGLELSEDEVEEAGERLRRQCYLRLIRAGVHPRRLPTRAYLDKLQDRAQRLLPLWRQWGIEALSLSRKPKPARGVRIRFTCPHCGDEAEMLRASMLIHEHPFKCSNCAGWMWRVKPGPYGRRGQTRAMTDEELWRLIEATKRVPI